MQPSPTNSLELCVSPLTGEIIDSGSPLRIALRGELDVAGVPVIEAAAGESLARPQGRSRLLRPPLHRCRRHRGAAAGGVDRSEGRRNSRRGRTNDARSRRLLADLRRPRPLRGRGFDGTRAHGGMTTPIRGGPHGVRETQDGTEVFYKDWGDGPTVVLCHGWPLSSDSGRTRSCSSPLERVPLRRP